MKITLDWLNEKASCSEYGKQFFIDQFGADGAPEYQDALAETGSAI